MTFEQKKEILKTVPKDSVIRMIVRGAKPPVCIGTKVEDHGDTMIIMVRGIKTPILYSKLWHEKIAEVEDVIAKLDGYETPT